MSFSIFFNISSSDFFLGLFHSKNTVFLDYTSCKTYTPLEIFIEELDKLLLKNKLDFTTVNEIFFLESEDHRSGSRLSHSFVYTLLAFNKTIKVLKMNILKFQSLGKKKIISISSLSEKENKFTIGFYNELQNHIESKEKNRIIDSNFFNSQEFKKYINNGWKVIKELNDIEIKEYFFILKNKFNKI